MVLDDADYALLDRIERGEHIFRRASGTPAGREAFAGVASRLFGLRDRGLIRLPESRISRTDGGEYLVIGPCDLTLEGRAALERDRRFGPRSSGQAGDG